MAKKMATFIIVIGFFLCTLFVQEVLAQEKSFTVGMRIGAFNPQDEQVKGSKQYIMIQKGSKQVVVSQVLGPVLI